MYKALIYNIMKRFITLAVVMAATVIGCTAQNRNAMKTIKLNQPDLQRGESVMQALSKRQSTRVFADKMLSLQDLSDLLWAANGINRPDGRRTAPSALNKQDIKTYVCTADGCYYYNHETHALEFLSKEDIRPAKEAPVVLVLVADVESRWAGIDAGIVSQNISLFCSGSGLATYPRGMFDAAVMKSTLKLKEEQVPLLCHPVGYFQ